MLALDVSQVASFAFKRAAFLEDLHVVLHCATPCVLHRMRYPTIHRLKLLRLEVTYIRSVSYCLQLEYTSATNITPALGYFRHYQTCPISHTTLRPAATTISRPRLQNATSPLISSLEGKTPPTSESTTEAPAFRLKISLLPPCRNLSSHLSLYISSGLSSQLSRPHRDPNLDSGRKT